MYFMVALWLELGFFYFFGQNIQNSILLLVDHHYAPNLLGKESAFTHSRGI